MKNIVISKNSINALNNFNLPPIKSFGEVMAPVMIQGQFSENSWNNFSLVPYGPITLDPTAKVLHYGQEIFEGMKAYKNDDNVYLFRPQLNAKRFNKSALRLAMPTINEDLFLESVETLVNYCASFIPKERGASLYIRPFMFATDLHLGIKPSTKFTFLIIATPSTSYFAGDIKVYLERVEKRAVPGGTGNVKVGGNYAASMKKTREIHNKGMHQVLWTNVNGELVEELSGMNFFAVYDKKIITPNVGTTILSGITRDSIINLAKHFGYSIEETDISVNQLLDDIKTQKCTEAFSSGTASIIGNITSITDGEETYNLKFVGGEVSSFFKDKLMNIQEGKCEDPFGWRQKVTIQKSIL